MTQPGSLSSLALDAISLSVYNLCSRLITTPKIRTTKSKRLKLNPSIDIEKAKCVCSQLCSMVSELPSQLADDVTNKLLDSIDNWDYEIGNCRCDSLEEDIFSEIVASVIHPRVTRIAPASDLLDCSDIFHESVFCSSLCVKVVLKNVSLLCKLTALHVPHLSRKFSFPDVNFPANLVEFSGRCDDHLLTKIGGSCKRLKYLDVFGSSGITNTSIDVILKMEFLERLNISQTRITSVGIKSLLLGLKHESELQTSCTLKHLAVSRMSYSNLKCIEDFPNLSLSLTLRSCKNFDLSKLYSLKNLRGLQIKTSLRDVNMMLQEIGSQLVYLDVEIFIFSPFKYYDDYDENLEVSEVLKIGQFCSCLKCLHITMNHYIFPRMREHQGPLLPGFETVQCLTIQIEYEKCKASSFLTFLISQCVNLKKLILEFDRHIFNVHDFIVSVIQRGYLNSVELVCFRPFCDRCSRGTSGEDLFSEVKAKQIVQLLTGCCDKLRVIGLDSEFHSNYFKHSQRYRIVPTSCRCK